MFYLPAVSVQPRVVVSETKYLWDGEVKFARTYISTLHKQWRAACPVIARPSCVEVHSVRRVAHQNKIQTTSVRSPSFVRAFTGHEHREIISRARLEITHE